MKRPQQGGKKGRNAKRKKGDDFIADDDESVEEMDVLSEDDVANAIARQYKRLRELPKFFDTLDKDVRDGLVILNTDARVPTVGEFSTQVFAAKKLYETKKAWDAAGASLAKTKYLASGIADGELVVLFMSIGNGDCIFVRTPGGSVIVIDCGSRKRPDGNYRKRITDVLKTHFLNTTTKQKKKPELYAVILTHADQDHYNELEPILKPNIEAIRHLFHTDDLSSYTINPKKANTTTQPTTRKKVIPKKSVTEEFLRSNSAFRNKVTINSTAVGLDKSDPFSTTPYVLDAKAKTIKILDETWKGAKTEITLLAGGIADRTETNRQVMAEDTRQGRPKGVKRDRYAKLLHARGTGEENNAASIVTLIQSRGKKFLLCGDATYLTEVFLLNNHKNAIKDVDVAQFEHHGSGTAHAGGVYVETINPLFAVASSGTHEGDENPRWRAIEKYLGYKKRRGSKQQTRVVRLRTDMAKHLVEAYDENKDLVDYTLWKPHENKGLYSTRSNGDVCFKVNTKGELRLDNT